MCPDTFPAVVIRDASEQDMDTIVQFNSQLAFESEGLTLDLKVLREGVRFVMQNPALGRYFVATVDGQVIGQTMISFEPSDWRNGLVVWLQSVYIRPDQRRRGVFKKLYQHIYHLYQSQKNVRLIRLYVEQANQQGLKTYQALGMEETHYKVFEAAVHPQP